MANRNPAHEIQNRSTRSVRKALYEATATLAGFVASHQGEMYPSRHRDGWTWKTGQKTIVEMAPHSGEAQAECGGAYEYAPGSRGRDALEVFKRDGRKRRWWAHGQ